MININPDIVCTIIQKAKEFQAQESVDIPENPEEYSEEQLNEILENHKNDLTYLEVIREIEKLEPDQKATLVAIMYLGRGDYDISEWNEALKFAAQNLTHHTGVYLLGRPQVADFLEEGLNLLGYSCEE